MTIATSPFVAFTIGIAIIAIIGFWPMSAEGDAINKSHLK